MEKQYEHAYSNAKGWYEEIRDAYRKFNAETQEQIEERMREGALSVLVREPWHEVGAVDVTPAEYEILLTTGGPALRVWGDLDNYGQVDTAQLQMQDWDTPWREVWPCEVNEMTEARVALMWFANLFYYGEG